MLHKNTNITGVILLGGKSKRMGQDKKLLIYSKQTFLENAINLLKAVGCKEIIFSGISANSLNNVTNNKKNSNYICLPDVLSNKGPIAGILNVLQQVDNNKWLLFIPVDMPLLTTEVINILLQDTQEKLHKIDTIFFKNYVFPFFLKNKPEIINIIKIHIAQQKFAIKYLLNSLNNIAIVAPSNIQNNLININTPSDYELI